MPPPVSVIFPISTVLKEHSVKPLCDQLESQLFEPEYFAEKDSVFVPADVAAIVYPSQKETLGVRELFIQPIESFDSPNSPVPGNGAPLSVVIRAGTPYFRMAASQIARTCFRSIRETIWQRIRQRLWPWRFAVNHVSGLFCNASAKYAQILGPFPAIRRASLEQLQMSELTYGPEP